MTKTQLEQRLSELRVQPGDLIRFRHTGQHMPGPIEGSHVHVSSKSNRTPAMLTVRTASGQVSVSVRNVAAKSIVLVAKALPFEVRQHIAACHRLVYFAGRRQVADHQECNHCATRCTTNDNFCSGCGRTFVAAQDPRMKA